MVELNCREVVEALKGELLAGKMNTVFTGVSTDSRKIAAGELFIPIAGERFDGHDFIEEALRKGAAGTLTARDAVVYGPDSSSGVPGKMAVIRVDDTLRALGSLAAYYRSRFDVPFVGVTGSVGKTSTKDMLAAVLSQSYNVLRTEGNFNNEIGLPLTMFKLDGFHQVGVAEMGMSGAGEISRLTAIVRPRIAVITNIGISHIEKLGSRQNILKAKMEILEGLESGGLLVVNGDDSLLQGLKGLLKCRMVRYGLEEGLEYRATDIKNLGENGTSFDICIGNSEYSVTVPVPGIHNIYNALAAIAAGDELGVAPSKMIEGIALFKQEKMRMNIISCKGFKLIDDAYNSSPQSAKAALDVLKDISRSGRTVAVLGDMLEMGEWAPEAHYETGRYAASKGVDYLVAVGENGTHTVRGAVDGGLAAECTAVFPGCGEASDYLSGLIRQEDYILVKGSRAVKMECIVEALKRLEVGAY